MPAAAPHAHAARTVRFYRALGLSDPAMMIACYAPDVTFSDPALPALARIVRHADRLDWREWLRQSRGFKSARLGALPSVGSAARTTLADTRAGRA